MALQKWSDNLAQGSLQGNYDGYIQSSLLQLRLTGPIGSSPANGTAVYSIKENTAYKVRLLMDTRFRVAAADSIAMNTAMSNYYRDPADLSDATSAGAYKEAEITSQAGQVYLPVVYWAAGGAMGWQEVFGTIEVRESIPGVLEVTPPTKTEYQLGEGLDTAGMEVSVAWGDGSREAVTDYTVSGFDSSRVGSKTVTVAYQGGTATFTVRVHVPCTVVWLSDTGEKIKEEAVPYGGAATPPEMQEKEGYLLTWDKDYTAIVRNTVIQAVYVQVVFTVQWVDWDGTVLKTEAVDHGVAATPPANPAREGYIFTGWDKAFENISADTTVTAQYEVDACLVRFLGCGQEVLKEEQVPRGKDATPPAITDITDDTAVSLSWDGDHTGITQDTDIYAVFSVQCGTQNLADVTSTFRARDSYLAFTGTGGMARGTGYFGGLYKKAVTAEIHRGVTNIPKYEFQECTSLAEVTIPDSVTTIGGYAFRGCTGLTEVTIPGSVTTIWGYEFYGCTGLAAVTIQDSVTEISDSMFCGCTSLAEVTIPDSVTTIWGYAFYGCTGLAAVTIPDSVTTIGGHAFYGCTGLSAVTIPNFVTAISAGMFCGCTGLTEVTIPNFVTVIGNEAFGRCTGLTEVTIPGSVTTLGRSTFCGCTGLAEITIPGSVTTLEDDVFCGCTGLTEVTIPNFVTVIGNEAFDGCTGLTEVTIPNFVTVMGERAFKGCKRLTKVTILGSVTTLGRAIFHGCTGLTEITIPNSVTEIGYRAFYQCTGLTEITIPDSVTEISDRAFSECRGMEKIKILGPETVIDPGSETISGTAVIYGYKGSTAEYYASLHERTFVAWAKVVFLDIDGAELKRVEVECGQDATPPAELPRHDILEEHFTFGGWEPPCTAIKEDTDCRAVYTIKSYMVTWLGWDGAVLKTETVPYGGAATPPETNPVQEGHAFTGWDTEYSYITGDTSITALFEAYVGVTSVTLEPDTLELTRPKTAKLYAAVQPGDASDQGIGWVSSDTGVATVSDDGAVMAVGAGAATVTAYAHADAAIRASCQVAVAADGRVSRIVISPIELEIEVGKSEVLAVDVTAGMDADLTLVWQTSSSAVAYAVDGKVAARAVGVATITAVSVSDPMVSAQCRVAVVGHNTALDHYYEQDSVQRKLVVHSKDGKFADLTNQDLVAESLVVKESLCEGSPLKFGGCISNYFEVVTCSRQFYGQEPEGEIEVYHLAGSQKVYLFTGVIDSAKRQDNLLTRKIVAYDRLHTVGELDVAGWYHSLSFPITQGDFRDKLLSYIGLPQKRAALWDDLSYVPYNNPDEHITVRKLMKDMCEFNFCFAHMDRRGVLEYISLEPNTRAVWMKPAGTWEYVPGAEEVKGYASCNFKEPVYRITGWSLSDIIESVDEEDNIGSYEIRNNFYYGVDALACAGTQPPPLDTQRDAGHPLGKKFDEVSQTRAQEFTAVQKGNPLRKVGGRVKYTVKKRMEDGTEKDWVVESYIISRELTGNVALRDTYSARNQQYGMTDTLKARMDNNTYNINKLFKSGTKAKSVAPGEWDPSQVPDGDKTIYLVQGEVEVS